MVTGAKCFSSTSEKIGYRLGGRKNETHVDLCLLQEVAKIQGGICLLVHSSCQIQAASRVVATENLVTDKDNAAGSFCPPG